MKNIHKIVITGGPCAGKSTAMSWMQNAFTERGYHVLFVPETATELISGGVAPWTCASNLDYQRGQVELQLAKEAVFMQAAQGMQDKALIVCDRGIIDNKAYMTQEEFSQIAGEHDSSEVELRDDYDAVFHLVTAAKGAEEFYTTINNEARRETPEEAAALDDQLIAAWTGHPHFRVIDNSTGFEEKMKRLISEVASYLGEPEPYEVERKFLIEYPDVKMLRELPNCQQVEIMQTYLQSPDGDEVRVRQRGENGHYIYYKTVKRTVSILKRLETESRLTQREYVELLMDADTSRRQIRKTRFCLTWRNQYFEIDVYPFWDDKAIVEIELIDEGQEIVFPSFLRMIREVTGEEMYRNAVIAEKTDAELDAYESCRKRNVFAIGRWMPLHLGHKAFLTKLAREYDLLVIGIGSCYENGTVRNCIPAVLREKMLRCMLQAEGIASDKVKIIPIQDYADFHDWMDEVLEICERNRITHFCTGNQEDILQVLQEKGMELPFSLVNPETESEFPYHATDIRQAICEGNREQLEHMVPGEILPMVEQCITKEVLAARDGQGKEFIPGRQTVDMVFLLSDPADHRKYVLLGERDQDKQDFPGVTALPGGGILQYESPLDAVVRVFECETGIDADVIDNTGEPAMLRMKQFDGRKAPLYFIDIYASEDERINGSRGGASQCFGICLEISKETAEKFLHSRHDMNHLRFVPLQEALKMRLAFEQSKMLSDAVGRMKPPERLNIVDAAGVPTGESVERTEAHAAGIRHGASHIFIYRIRDGKIEILLQRRSSCKDSFPGRLDISSAGHMEAGMDYLETALKELSEELGLIVEPEELQEAFTLDYQSEDEFHGNKFINNEFNQVYILKKDVDLAELELQAEEVSEVRWMDAQEILQRLREQDEEFCMDPMEYEKALASIRGIG